MCVGYASDAEEKEYSIILQQALNEAVRLDKFPKSTVDIQVLVLQNDGGTYQIYTTISNFSRNRSFEHLVFDYRKFESLKVYL